MNPNQSTEMTIAEISLLRDIETFIKKEDDLNVVKPETRARMALSLFEFIRAATKKFIAGQQEHGGDITDRNLDEELYKEQLDMFWYGEAKTWQYDMLAERHAHLAMNQE